jgi:hypothetical protein
MIRDIDIDDTFGKALLERAAKQPPKEARAFYNVDGDCIEAIWSDESFKAERLDKFVTVYHGRESGQIVGAVIKGVKKWIEDFLKESPGFRIEIEDGRLRLRCLFTAGMWQQGDDAHIRKYKILRDQAERYELEVEMPSLCSS